MSELVLEVENLTKDFGELKAVDRISFSIPKGKIIGLLGPNGAGKTTTIHMLLGVTLPDAGTINFFGKDVLKHRAETLQKVGFASAYGSLTRRLTVKENLLVFANLYSVKKPQQKISELLLRFEIEDQKDVQFQELSSGLRTRVILCKALLNDPEIILMDEPTASLDPDIADKTLTLIEDLKKERGLSILYTSHDMDEVTRLCDEVIFLNRGKIFTVDTPLGLTKRIPGVKLRVIFDADPKFVAGYLLAHQIKHEIEGGLSVMIRTEEGMVPRVLFGMQKAGIPITNIDVAKPTLEDAFLDIVRGEHNEVV